MPRRRFRPIALTSLLIHPSLMIDPHVLHMTLPSLPDPRPILPNINDGFRIFPFHPRPQTTHPGQLLLMRLIQGHILQAKLRAFMRHPLLDWYMMLPSERAMQPAEARR